MKICSGQVCSAQPSDTIQFSVGTDETRPLGPRQASNKAFSSNSLSLCLVCCIENRCARGCRESKPSYTEKSLLGGKQFLVSGWYKAVNVLLPLLSLALAVKETVMKCL